MTNTESPTGEQLALEVRCLSCHTDQDTSAPAHAGRLWGTYVQLADGRTVAVDDEYVTRSITEPGADVVEGHNPIMPTFPLEDDEMDHLVDWVRSLG
jgi:cytochrome c oxidase subunit 2